ncbi:MAG: FkbM family methyltransferase [Thermoguttaceae bacterium]|nr:FkbM family methyltransferase [Thermoguttaceae bacterium]
MSWFNKLFSIEKHQYYNVVTIFGHSYETRRKGTFHLLEQDLKDIKYGWPANKSFGIILNNSLVLSSFNAPPHIHQNSDILNYISTLGPFTTDKPTRDDDCAWLKTIREILHVMDVKDQSDNFVRIGASRDGGYVMFNQIQPGTVAYSIGIEQDVSWDMDMVQHGLELFMYDHTIDALPVENEHFHFFKTGVTGKKQISNCKTLEELIQDNHHENRRDLILKMDVEGCEWDVFNQVSEITLNQFSQIVFELHGIGNSPYNQDMLSAIEKLNRTHQLVYLHPNNFGGVKWFGHCFLPMTLEATYVRRCDHSFVPTDKFFPTTLDRPCDPHIPEIILGKWNIQDKDARAL